MKKTKKRYSLEFKLRAVELSKLRGSVSGVTQELAISLDNLKRWKKEYALGQLGSNSVKEKTPQEVELLRLQKELREVKLERDILKKAVRYKFISEHKMEFPVEKMCRNEHYCIQNGKN